MEDQPHQDRTDIFWSRYRNALAAPLLRHASAGGPLRYTHGARTPGTCGCLHVKRDALKFLRILCYQLTIVLGIN